MTELQSELWPSGNHPIKLIKLPDTSMIHSSRPITTYMTWRTIQQSMGQCRLLTLQYLQLEAQLDARLLYKHMWSAGGDGRNVLNEKQTNPESHVIYCLTFYSSNHSLVHWQSSRGSQWWWWLLTLVSTSNIIKVTAVLAKNDYITQLQNQLIRILIWCDQYDI